MCYFYIHLKVQKTKGQRNEHLFKIFLVKRMPVKDRARLMYSYKKYSPQKEKSS